MVNIVERPRSREDEHSLIKSARVQVDIDRRSSPGDTMGVEDEDEAHATLCVEREIDVLYGLEFLAAARNMRPGCIWPSCP